jgi:hypothetical protein
MVKLELVPDFPAEDGFKLLFIYMETNFNELFDNFNNCLQPDFPDPYTRDSTRRAGILKITDIFNNKNDTEIRNIIELLMNAKEKFYMNRSKILEGKPRLSPGLPNNHSLFSEERSYLENAVENSLEYQSIGDAYIYRINYLLSRHIHSMYGVILGASGFIDTVPKYLECHIELYENILRLKSIIDTEKLRVDTEKLREMEKFNNPNYIVSKILELKKQIKLETSPDKLKVNHILIKDLQKRIASLIKIKNERQDQQVKEEYETLIEDPQVKEEETQRLRREVQGFISGGKKNKKSKKNKGKKNKSKKNKGKKNKGKRFRI